MRPRLSWVKRALGVISITAGVFLIVGGILVATGDPYDAGRVVHAVFGGFYAVVGLGLCVLGWWLVRRRTR